MNIVRIEIDTKTFVRFWLVVIGFALVAIGLYSARTALLIVGISLFLAIALSPPVNKLAKVLSSKSRLLSTAIAYVFVMLFLGVIIFLVIPPIADQTAKFIQNFPSFFESAVNQSSGVQKFIDNYHLQPDVDKVLVSVKDSAGKSVSGIGTALVTGIGSLVSVLTSFILVLVLTFLMLVEGPAWMGRLWSVYSDKSRMEHHRRVAGRMYNMVTNYVTGQLTVSSIAGVVAGIAVFVLMIMFKLPTNLAVPSAAMVFISSLVPVFGAMIGAIFVSVLLALNNITAAIIFLVFFILYQQLEANYISPAIQSKRVNLSALIILIAVTVGIYTFGIVGGIISIPIAGCIKVLIDDYIDRSKLTHAKPAKTN